MNNPDFAIKGLCGWLDQTAEQTSPQTLTHMLQALPAGAQEIQQHTGPTLAAAAAGGLLHVAEDGLVAMLEGQPRWADGRSGTGMAKLLAEAYRSKGDACVEQLRGAFSLAVIDPQNRRALLAIDRLGQRDLYFHLTDGRLFFASSASAVRAHPDCETGLDYQGLFHFLFFHMIPGPGTAFTGIEKLQSAQLLSFADGKASKRHYWVPEFSEPRGRDVPRPAETLELIEAGVRRLNEPGISGAFLSGGLDSSTVSGMLARVSEGPAKTFSIGFDAEGYDEIAYARMAVERFGTEQHEYYVQPDDIVDTVPLIAAAYDEPFGNSSALPAYFCARLAKDNGVQRLLAGDGGDEIFAGNERYAKQKVFETYFMLPGFLRSGVIEPLLNVLPALWPVRKGRRYVEQANVRLPDRLNTYVFLRNMALSKVFQEDFLQHIDPGLPLRLQEEYFHRPERASALNRHLYLDWQFTLTDNDLRKVNRMCDLAGVEVVYPMLDDDLVEFTCRIPSKDKLKGLKLRDFYKRAVQGFLPDEIINKPKHGFGLPFGVWMKEHKPLQELAYDNLAALRKRPFIQPALLDHAIEMHRSDTAAYYGELIWILMMLELWLDSHGL